MLEALEMGVKVKWVQNLEESLRMFGWGGMHELRGIGRFVDGGSEESFDGGSLESGCKEAQRHPKLDLIGRLLEKECEGRGI